MPYPFYSKFLFLKGHNSGHNKKYILKYPEFLATLFLQTSLNWAGNTIDLLEEIYAFHNQKVINVGNIKIKELATHFGTIFTRTLDQNIY